jgi:nucleotide-binding universal stress UspA family protein
MLNNILVPLDGSPVGESALPHAAALAAQSGAKLILVRAAHTARMAAHSAAAQVRVLSEAEAYLELRAAEVRATGRTVETGVPFGATPAEWIVEEVDLRHADLIVMATHGRVGPARWLHGSVAEAVVSHSPIPVLLVRAADGARAVDHFEWQQPVLLVALDGSELAEAAVPAAINFARALSGRVVLLSVVPEPGQLMASHGGAVPYGEQTHAALQEEARAYLRAPAVRVASIGVPVETLLRTGDPAIQIALAAHERNAAAVVMATHGRTGIVRAVLGSVAGEVVHSTSSPVLLIRPPQLHAAEHAPLEAITSA